MKLLIKCLFGAGVALLLGGQLSDVLAASKTTLFRVYLPGIQGQTVFSVGPLNIDFGSVAIGATSSAQQVQVGNTGTTTLILGAMTPTGPFAVSSECGSSLPQMGSCAASVSFSPTSVGAVNGTLSVSTSGGIRTVALTGIGLGTQLSATPSTVSFGAEYTGLYQSSTQSVTLKNNGNVPTTSLSFSLPSGVTESDNCGQTLAAGASCVVNLTYAATTVGSLNANVQVSSQDSNVQVSATGTASAPARIFVATTNTAPYLCNLNANGGLGTCSVVSGADSGTLGLVVKGSTAYEETSSGNTRVCSIGSGDSLSGCSTVFSITTGVYGIAYDNGHIYIPQYSAVQLCIIGSGCTVTGSGLSASITLAVGGGFAYVGNASDYSVKACRANADGTFSGCTSTGAVTNNYPAGMALSGNTLYVAANVTGNIFACSVSGLTVSGCTVVATGLHNPRGLAVSNGILYVANTGDNTVAAYKVGAGGTLTLVSSVTVPGTPWGVSPAP